MKRLITWLLLGSAWGTLLWGALQLQRLPASSFGDHHVCGPWGCGPPVVALVACHVFWFALLGPPTVLAAFRLPSRWADRLGALLVFASICGFVAVGAWEAATWYPQASQWQREYVVRRYFFALATLVDLPVVQALIIGSGVWLAGHARSLKSARASATGSDGTQGIEIPSEQTDSTPEF